MTYIASFDPGRRNFAFCVEEFDAKQLASVEELSYNTDGTPTPESLDQLDQIYLNGRIVLCRNVNILCTDKAGKTVEPEVFHNLTLELDKYTNIWDKCEYFLIETQMSFGRKLNLPAVKIAQHVQSYFIIRYGLNKKVIDFPAYHKTQILGAPKEKGKKKFKAMEKPQRKKWAVETAERILEMREEENPFSGKKRDDLSDCLLMCQAGKYLYYVSS